MGLLSLTPAVSQVADVISTYTDLPVTLAEEEESLNDEEEEKEQKKLLLRVDLIIQCDEYKSIFQLGILLSIIYRR